MMLRGFPRLPSRNKRTWAPAKSMSCTLRDTDWDIYLRCLRCSSVAEPCELLSRNTHVAIMDWPMADRVGGFMGLLRLRKAAQHCGVWVGLAQFRQDKMIDSELFLAGRERNVDGAPGFHR